MPAPIKQPDRYSRGLSGEAITMKPSQGRRELFAISQGPYFRPSSSRTLAAGLTRHALQFCAHPSDLAVRACDGGKGD